MPQNEITQNSGASKTNVNVPTFRQILLFQAYFKHNIMQKLGKPLMLTPKKTWLIEKRVRYFLLYEHI